MRQSELDSDQVLAFWRGKVALTGSAPDLRPLWLPASHPVFTSASEPPVFLGDDDGVLRHARDLSSWVPDGVAPSVGAFFDPSVQHHPELPDTAGFYELRGVMTALAARDAELVATAKALLGWHQSHRYCAACGQPSSPAEGGWMRLCPSCETRHFPRTDPVVIMLVTHGNDLLLGRSPHWPEGMYSLLAGFVEPGETLEAAVAREVLEEAGIEVGPVRYISCQPWPFPTSLMVGMAAEATTREITLDPAELDDAVWLSREDVLAATAGQHPKIKPARQGAIARTLIEEWLAGRIGEGK